MIKKVKQYWLLPTDKRFVPALKKINVAPSYIDILIGKTCDATRRSDKVFISHSNSADANYEPCFGWGWMPYTNKPEEEDKGVITNDYYETQHYEFKGIVDIEELELKLAINKYNL